MKTFIKKYLTFTNIFCIAIFLVGCAIRLYNLSGLPFGIHPDEAYAAYNAYSMANYKMDSFGYHNPVYFIAWGGGMNVLNSYFMIPMIKLLGMSLWSIRLPQAILSCFTMIIIYLLVKKIFDKNYAVLALFLVAINPWHIMMTRNNIESGLLPFFFISGLYFFVKGIDDTRYLYISAIMYGLSLYAYATIWPVLPFIILLQAAYVIYYKKISIKDINLWLSALLLGVIALPLVLFMLVNNGIIPEINTAFISIPKLAAYRGGEISFSNILNSTMKMLNMIDSQDDGQIMNATKEYGFYYKFSNAFMLVGLCILMRRVVLSFKNKKFDSQVLLAISLVFMFFLGMIIKNPHATRLNCIHFLLLICIVMGIVELSNHYFKYLKYVMYIVYALMFVAFVGFYKNNYNNDVRDLYRPQIDYCMEDVVNSDKKVFIDSDISYSVVLYYSRMPVKEYIDSVVYDDRNIMYMSALSFGRYTMVKHPDKEGKLSFEDYKIDQDGIYVLSNDVAEQMKSQGYNVNSYGDFCVIEK